MADYTLSARITGDSKSFTKALDEANNKIKNFNEKSQNMGDKLKDVGGSMTKFGGKVTLATAPLLLMTKAVFSTGMEFQASMSKVQAISGATGKDLELLESSAREMGKTTRYSASEAAEGMSFMALAGYDTTQIISALPSVLSLATAGGLELARASEIVTGNLNAYGLGAEEAARVSDVLAFAQANSGTSAEELASALEVVAPAAAGAGHEIEDTAAIIGILADQNIKGSKAGTYLNSMYTDIAKSAKDGSIAIGESSVAVYDASGNMRAMSDIVADVNTATMGMTGEQKNNALMSVFQQQSLKGVNALLNAQEGDLETLKTGLESADGAAERMALTMDENLQGKVLGLGSSFDELKLRLFDVSEGPMDTIVIKITEIVDKLSSLDDATLSTIAAVAGIAIVTGPLIIVLGSLITSTGVIIGLVGKLTGVLQLLSLAKLKEKADTLVLIGLYAKDAAVKTISTAKTVAMTVATNTWSIAAKAGAIATKLLGGAIAFLTSPIGIAVVAIAGMIAIGVALWQNWDTVKARASQLGSFISSKFKQIGEWMGNPITRAKETINSALESIKGFFSRLRLKFPKIEMPKLPKFAMTGKFGLNPPSVPKLSINWHAAGGIFTKPTILGGHGFGEAGAEAILPISKLGGMVADTMDSMGYNNNEVITQNQNITVVLDNANIYDSRDVKEIMKQAAVEISREVDFG